MELPAVMVASPCFTPNTGFNVASFSTLEFGRRLSSRYRPRNGLIRSSKKPRS
ncbi:Uncharacterised protein [Mycobacteroides abscessus subsp. abscessus]|nr:Uncharacterised protein [Mycobacteroides abscessus subsp. abscessus]